MAPLDRKGGMEIRAYSTSDGIFHGFHGQARWTSAAHDSLVFTGKRRAHLDGADPSGDPDDKDPVTIRLARAQVTTLLYKGNDPGKSSLVGFGTVTAVILGFAALYIAFAAGLGD